MARSITLALIAALAISSIATATSVQKFSVRDLAQKSRSVVVGTVVSSESRYDDNEIYTYITVRVVEGLKGSRKGETIVVRQLGGQVGSIASVVPGTASFRNGEEVVLFLSQNDKTGHPWVVGLQQGKYSISTDEQGKKRVRRDASGLKLVGGDIAGAMPEATSLDVFLDEVRTEVGIPIVVLPAEGVQ